MIPLRGERATYRPFSSSSYLRFAQQTIWITGASSGIGEALAYRFAQDGARLVLSSRRVAELERVRRGCVRPDEHVVAPLDLARSDTLDAVAADVLAQIGHLDILVNNAGVSQRALASEADPLVERAIMEVDYFGQVALTRAVLPAMRARRRGRIVVVSSVMGYVGTPGRSTYAAAKHALHGYFDSLRAELWADGIRVTLACPGYVRTAVSANALGPHGEHHGVTDPTHLRGMSADHCAAKIVRAVAGDRDEVYLGREALGVYVQRFLPWLFRRLARRMTVPVRR